MSAKKIILFLLLLSGNSFCQKLNSADSLNLLNTWKQTIKFIKAKNIQALDTICIDSISCTICKFENDSVWDYVKSKSYFLNNDLDAIRKNKKLWTSIATKKPRIILGTYSKRTGPLYTIAIEFRKPGSLGPKYEGADYVFDFVKRGNTYRLAGIETVP